MVCIKFSKLSHMRTQINDLFLRGNGITKTCAAVKRNNSKKEDSKRGIQTGTADDIVSISVSTYVFPRNRNIQLFIIASHRGTK